MAALEKTLSRWPTERSHANSQSPAEAAPQGAIRISPKSLRNHRRRLKLSQAQTGKLLGVSTASVTFWELGRTSPRGKNRKAIAELRQMSARDAKLLLETL